MKRSILEELMERQILIAGALIAIAMLVSSYWDNSQKWEYQQVCRKQMREAELKWSSDRSSDLSDNAIILSCYKNQP